jgi:hypothetical protein
VVLACHRQTHRRHGRPASAAADRRSPRSHQARGRLRITASFAIACQPIVTGRELGRVVGPDDVHVLPLLAGLHRRVRRDNRALGSTDSCSVTSTNAPAHSRRSRFGNVALSRMVSEVWSTALSTKLSVPSPRARRCRPARRARAAYPEARSTATVGQQACRHGEAHVGGRHLVDHHKRRGVVGAHKRAGMHEQRTRAARDRRDNGRVLQLQPCILELGRRRRRSPPRTRPAASTTARVRPWSSPALNSSSARSNCARHVPLAWAVLRASAASACCVATSNCRGFSVNSVWPAVTSSPSVETRHFRSSPDTCDRMRPMTRLRRCRPRESARPLASGGRFRS